MTKAELMELLESTPDDACVEVVKAGEHFDVNGVLQYNDNGVIIIELGIWEPKILPESEIRKLK